MRCLLGRRYWRRCCFICCLFLKCKQLCFGFGDLWRIWNVGRFDLLWDVCSRNTESEGICNVAGCLVFTCNWSFVKLVCCLFLFPLLTFGIDVGIGATCDAIKCFCFLFCYQGTIVPISVLTEIVLCMILGLDSRNSKWCCWTKIQCEI